MQSQSSLHQLAPWSYFKERVEQREGFVARWLSASLLGCVSRFFFFGHVIVVVYTKHSLSHKKFFFFYAVVDTLHPVRLPSGLGVGSMCSWNNAAVYRATSSMRRCQSVTVNNPAQLSLCIVSNKHYSLVGCSYCLFTFTKCMCTLYGKNKGIIYFCVFSFPYEVEGARLYCVVFFGSLGILPAFWFHIIIPLHLRNFLQASFSGQKSFYFRTSTKLVWCSGALNSPAQRRKMLSSV